MTGILRQLLREKFAPPAYAFFEEVKNQTGYQKRSERYADALALSLWPSRGIAMTGFELKMSRSDWKRELEDPSKAAEFMKYCTGWYVVAPEGIVERLELPATWGLIEVPKGGRKRLVIKVEAPKLTAEAWDSAFVAALLRRHHEQQAEITQQAIRDQLASEREKMKEEHLATMERAQRGEAQVQQHYSALLKRLGINQYDIADDVLDEAVRRVTPELDEVRAERQVLWQAQQATGALKGLVSTAESLVNALAPLEEAAKAVDRARQAARQRHYAEQTAALKASVGPRR